ncbi:MAG TPA: hypothetical protein VFB72_20085 [Verrucomicrobiae bacterium]|nr:hypothetical protein [Verrucomicrobiae bacterium]
MKVVKQLLILAASVGLLAGCASDRDHGAAGGVGNGSVTVTGSGQAVPTPPPAEQRPTGPNGSIGPGNPFGLGPGNTDNF